MLRGMSQFARSPVTAVLGPTNTGKTYLAIERMCGHASGMIGFPLRLLARENYDRVVAMKGAENVALVTGEERIVPPKARWFLCTAESMPLERETAFVALDEAQLGADPERGHVFRRSAMPARASCRACRAARRSSPSRRKKSMPWRRRSAGCAAARRW